MISSEPAVPSFSAGLFPNAHLDLSPPATPTPATGGPPVVKMRMTASDSPKPLELPERGPIPCAKKFLIRPAEDGIPSVGLAGGPKAKRKAISQQPGSGDMSDDSIDGKGLELLFA